MVVFPFSKLLHAPGVFFSPSRNQADDSRERRHVPPPGLNRPRAALEDSKMAEAKSEFDPKQKVHGDPLELPRLASGAMAASKPYVAAPDQQQALGFPGELAPDWQEKAIARLGELLDNSARCASISNSCVKCGACTDKCHYFLGTGDPKNMPVARQDLLRKVYRRYFTFAGKYFPGWSAPRT